MPDYITAEPVTWTATYNTPKRMRCGTRKRFIKLLMAKGISRNKANRAARMVQEMNKDKMWNAVSYRSFYILSLLTGALDEAKEAEDNA